MTDLTFEDSKDVAIYLMNAPDELNSDPGLVGWISHTAEGINNGALKASLFQRSPIMIDVGTASVIAVGGGILLKVTQVVAPIFGNVIGAWVGSRSGRNVVVKVGDIEVEAHTAEEAVSLLTRAEDIKRRNEPGKIVKL